MVFEEDRWSTAKESASMEMTAKKAGYNGAYSLLFKKSFRKVLLGVFGRNKKIVIT